MQIGLLKSIVKTNVLSGQNDLHLFEFKCIFTSVTVQYSLELCPKFANTIYSIAGERPHKLNSYVLVYWIFKIIVYFVFLPILLQFFLLLYTGCLEIVVTNFGNGFLPSNLKNVSLKVWLIMIICSSVCSLCCCKTTVFLQLNKF